MLIIMFIVGGGHFHIIVLTIYGRITSERKKKYHINYRVLMS